jgi:hypothetical protein
VVILMMFVALPYFKFFLYFNWFCGVFIASVLILFPWLFLFCYGEGNIVSCLLALACDA